MIPLFLGVVFVRVPGCQQSHPGSQRGRHAPSVSPASRTAELYQAYYVPLSHFFVHANAFTLMRHVRPDGTLHRRPAFLWARRSAIRMADGCTGILAANIANKSGIPPGPFTRYATAHLGRLLAPAFVVFLRGACQSVSWRRIPGVLKALITTRRYANGPGRHDDPAQQEARIRECFTRPSGH